MWKRLKRFWTRGQGDPDGDAHGGPELVSPAPTTDHAGPRASDGRSAPVVIDDPLVERLRDYDRVAREEPQHASLALRELMLEHPTDARVLRRAAELMLDSAEASEDPGPGRLDELGELGGLFGRAARTSQAGPLAELAETFLGLDDFGLALAFADGACQRARPGRERGQGEPSMVNLGLLLGALALARTGQHAAVLERLEPIVRETAGPAARAASRGQSRAQAGHDGAGGPREEPGDDGGGDEAVRLGARVRYAVSALLVGAFDRLSALRGTLGEAESWMSEVAARARDFAPAPRQPSAAAGPNTDDDADERDATEALDEVTGDGDDGTDEGGDARQRLLFLLYGAILLDDAAHERLEPSRLMRWMQAVSVIVRETMPSATRPAWVSPRGEVLARWLGALLPERAAMPLSARLPRQPVLVVLADDHDLATLVETVPGSEGLPIFQAIKDPGTLGSPVADIIGVFRPDVELPFELLEAERAADRVTPRMLAMRLQEEAEAEARRRDGPDGGGADEIDGFLAWFRARRAHFELGSPRALDQRIQLDPASL